jgi:hypothetical protein
MAVSGKAAAVIIFVTLVFGVLIAKRHEIFAPNRSRGPVAFSTAPAVSSNRSVHSVLRARELRILGPDESVSLWIRESADGSPGIWMTNARKTAVIEAGVHDNAQPASVSLHT